MSYTIAITGKGGVGKTTVAGLVALRLIASGRRPVLAVDADPCEPSTPLAECARKRR